MPESSRVASEAVGEHAFVTCWAWRHPRPLAAAGRCIGAGTDLAVDRRKAKRLAHRIRHAARLNGLPRVVHTSPLQRCASVGRILRRWGWRHHVDAALLEMDFGQWDGRPWVDIPVAEVDAWCCDFLHGRPGQGESLADVLSRAKAWHAAIAPARLDQGGPNAVLVVGHGGWMLAFQWLTTHADAPTMASQWPAPPAYGQCWQLQMD